MKFFPNQRVKHGITGRVGNIVGKMEMVDGEVSYGVLVDGFVQWFPVHSLKLTAGQKVRNALGAKPKKGFSEEAFATLAAPKAPKKRTPKPKAAPVAAPAPVPEPKAPRKRTPKPKVEAGIVEPKA